MALTTWLQWLTQGRGCRDRTHPRRRCRAAVPRLPFVPRLGVLEDRTVPTTFIVTSLGDSGTGTLRQAILNANANPGDDTITFAVTGTINLVGALPQLSTNIDIQGPGANLVSVRRNIGGDYGIFTVPSGATVALSGLTITNGSTSNGGGISNAGTLSVTAATVSDNGGGFGGGIYNTGTLSVTTSTVGNNAAVFGTGIYNEVGGTVTITASTLSGNWAAAGDGGAIYNAGTLTLTHSTLSGNNAERDGGGIFNLGTLHTRNTIIAGNTALTGPDLLGSLTTSGYNLIGNSSGGSGYAPTDLLGVDPRLGPLQANGGPTHTHALLASSPAINAGDPAASGDFDQRGPGFARIVGGRIDIGAYEVQPQADLPTVTVVVTDANAGEPNNTGMFTITRTGPITEPLTISLTLGGTATNGIDYATIATSLTIPVWVSSLFLPVSPLDDPFGEGRETVVLTLNPGAGYLVGSPNPATVSIADNDPPFNLSPVLAPIADLAVLSTQQTVSVALSASDLNDDPLAYTASAQSLAYVLRQQFGTFTYSAEFDNWGGRNEKWFLASGQWYFLLPSGELFRWTGGSGATGTSVGLVGASYYEDPLRLQNAAANDPHVGLAVNGNTLTITRDPTWVSAVVITATVFDGRGGSDSETFTVFVSLASPPPPTVSIEATDADAGEPANPGTFTITRTGPTTAPLTVSFTIAGTASNGIDYAAIPTSVTIPAGASSATVTVSPIDDSLVEGSETVVLTLTASGSYQVGSPVAAAVAIADNDPGNRPPVLQPIANRTVPATQQTVSVTLSASDADDDPLTYTASAQSLAWVLSQQHGQFVYHPVYDNWGGQNERWFLASGQWYFLLASGELFRWDGGSTASGTSVGLIGSSYYQDPFRLQNAAANDAHVSLSVAGNTLTITRDPTWVSAIVVTVTANDGRGGSDSETFTVTVTP